MTYTLCHTFSAVLAVEEDHQQHGDISFHGAYEQDEFDLNSQIFDQQQEIPIYKLRGTWAVGKPNKSSPMMNYTVRYLLRDWRRTKPTHILRI